MTSPIAPVTMLAIATSSSGKLAEFRDALAGLPLDLLSAADLGIYDFPEETGASYEENALLKAAHVALRSGLVTLADDSGLEVAALSGAPGVRTARYGGPGLTDGERMAHLLQRLRRVPAGLRTAKFRAVVVLATPTGTVHAFQGESDGEILEGPRGSDGFGYDPIFFSPELGKSFAEASVAEKRRVSHRGRALSQFGTWALTAEGRAALAFAPERAAEQ